MTLRKLFLLGSACWLVWPAAAQAPRNETQNFWNDPQFVRTFMGEFGVDSKIDPGITPDENKIFGNVTALLQANNRRGAIDALKAAIKPDASAALDYTLGSLYLQDGNNDLATASLEKAVAKFPTFLRAYKHLGLAYAAGGKFGNALTNLTRALELGGEDGNVYGILGYCYLNQSKPLSAEIAYSKAMMFAPDNPDWRRGYAQTLLQQGKYREAAAIFGEFLVADSSDADSWLHQANAFLALQENEKAAENFEVVRRLGKATPAVLNLLGDIYLNKGLGDLARALYLEAFRKDPGQDLERPLRSVEILANTKQMADAETLLDEINQKAGSRLSGAQKITNLRLRSRIQLAKGQTGEAVKTLEQIIAAEPLDGDALLLLADHYARRTSEKNDQQREDLIRAAMYFERAEKIKGFEARALVEHGQMLVRDGQYGKALPKLRQAQELRFSESVARYLSQVEEIVKRAN